MQPDRLGGAHCLTEAQAGEVRMAQVARCITSVDGIIWVNYNDLTATSLEIMVNKDE